jgi:hypothetical protein
MASYFTFINIFEELRFILELVAAELLFVWGLDERRKKFWLRFGLGLAGLIACSFGYFLLIYWQISAGYPTDSGFVYIYPFWYAGLPFLSILFLALCFRLSPVEALYKGLLGWCLQHIEYAIVNEALAIGVFPSLRDNAPAHAALYVALSLATCVLVYALVFRIFRKVMRKDQPVIFDNKPGIFIFYFALLAVTIFLSFSFQYLFNNGDPTQTSGHSYLAVVEDVLVCCLILLAQYSAYRAGILNQEKRLTERLLYEKDRQYKADRENIDIINRKCHDMKLQIAAFEKMSEEERGQSIEDLQKAIMIYDSGVKCFNPALNTLLSDKGLYCQEHGIRLSLIIDDSKLDFLSSSEIYSLIGNALDNAIEAVGKNPADKKVISLTISAKNGFVMMQTNNYFQGNLEIKDGLPVSTKGDEFFHGFGYKSMLYIAQKHGGTLQVKTDGGIFILEILLPIPQ